MGVCVRLSVMLKSITFAHRVPSHRYVLNKYNLELGGGLGELAGKGMCSNSKRVAVSRDMDELHRTTVRKPGVEIAGRSPSLA